MPNIRLTVNSAQHVCAMQSSSVTETQNEKSDVAKQSLDLDRIVRACYRVSKTSGSDSGPVVAVLVVGDSYGLPAVQQLNLSVLAQAITVPIDAQKRINAIMQFGATMYKRLKTTELTDHSDPDNLCTSKRCLTLMLLPGWIISSSALQWSRFLGWYAASISLLS